MLSSILAVSLRIPASLLDEIADVGILKPISRKHEGAADKPALKFIVKSGYDPYALITFFKRMMGRSPEGFKSVINKFYSTHPDWDKRISLLIEQIKKEHGAEAAPRSSDIFFQVKEQVESL